MPLSYTINQQLCLQQQQKRDPQFQVPLLNLQTNHLQKQQHDENNYFQNDTIHDDSQYDTSNTDVVSTSTTPYDYGSIHNENNKNKKRRSRETSESSCASDDGMGEYGSYVGGGDSINNTSGLYVNNPNDTSINGGDNSFIYKSTSNSDQNEKNIKKSKVIELYSQGERCVRKLSQLTGVPLTTVYRVIGKLKGINYNIPRGNGAGRKTILDTQDREILVEILSAQPRISRKALGKELEKRTGKSIHNSTLNRELCRLRHQGTVYPGNADSINSSLNVTQSPSTSSTTPSSTQTKLSPPQEQQTSTKQTHSRQQQQQLAIETNTASNSIPHHQLSSSSSTTSSLSTTSSYMAKDLIGTKSSSSRSSLKDQESKPLIQTPLQQPSLLTPSAAMIAAAAAALGYPSASASRLPLMTQMQSPFNAALAAYSSYLTGNVDFSQAFNAFNNTTPSLPFNFTNNINNDNNIDIETRKQIVLEAHNVCDSMGNIEAKPLTGLKPEIASQIMELINGGLSIDKVTRDDTIRKLTNFLIQRPVDKSYFENCLNEACVQLSIIKPALLTRRDDLVNHGKQLLENIDVFENGKR